MVLFCQCLVKIDESSPSPPPLNRNCQVDAASHAPLLDGFFERFFQRVQ